jgi:hypothetical protein
MDTTDDRDGDRQWNTKDVLVAIEVQCSGEMDEEVPKSIIMEELDANLYSHSREVYRLIVKTITFTDRLN